MRYEVNTRQIKRAASQFSLALLMCVCFQMSAHAQFAKPLLSGSNVSPSSLTPSLLHEQSVPTIINPERTTVFVYSTFRENTDSLPKRFMVLTIRPSTLTSEQIGDIDGILGINMLSGQRTIEADASKHQLELIQSVLAPSASDTTLGLSVINNKGQKEINKDPNAQQWAALRRTGDDALYIYKGPIPAAKTLARMVVIIGLVAATIYVAFAAFSITTGQAHGGNRVIAAAAGLVLLLMGYTIYRIMMINAVLKNGTIDRTVITRHLPLNGLVNDKFRPVADTPKVPTTTGPSTPRSGLKVQPLSGR